MIIDAGGGTVDFSTYTFVNDKPVEIEELTVPAGTYAMHFSLPANNLKRARYIPRLGYGPS
jgi:hypothetical protein